ncbi:MAG TPA: LysR substrate-binding domain-containing protein, partial [Thermopolyspora sp.]
AAVRLATEHPGVDLRLSEAEPPEALRMLRAGYVDVSVVFQYGTTGGLTPEENGVRMTPLLDERAYLVTPADNMDDTLAQHAEAKWIAGCDRCRSHLLALCAEAGFQPQISFTTDDFVAVQAMVAAGLGVTVLPGLALTAHRHPSVTVTELPGSTRHVYAATYGEPPDPPATAALLTALTETARAVG